MNVIPFVNSLATLTHLTTLDLNITFSSKGDLSAKPGFALALGDSLKQLNLLTSLKLQFPGMPPKEWEPLIDTLGTMVMMEKVWFHCYFGQDYQKLLMKVAGSLKKFQCLRELTIKFWSGFSYSRLTPDTVASASESPEDAILLLFDSLKEIRSLETLVLEIDLPGYMMTRRVYTSLIGSVRYLRRLNNLVVGNNYRAKDTRLNHYCKNHKISFKRMINHE